MKDKQIYFIEYDNKTLKFNGFDALDNFIKELKNGAKFTLYYVQAVQNMTKKENNQQCLVQKEKKE